MGTTDTRRGIDVATILALLNYYKTHASAIAAVVSALVVVFSGDKVTGVKQLFEALFVLFAGGAAVGLAAGNNDASNRLEKIETEAVRSRRFP